VVDHLHRPVTIGRVNRTVRHTGQASWVDP
jgi:hypothetical protein